MNTESSGSHILKIIQIVFGGKTICRYNFPENIFLWYLLSSIREDGCNHMEIPTLFFRKNENQRKSTANTNSQPEQEKLYEMRKYVWE